ncbi:MAG: hypothetical protein JNL72_01230 [Flavipsychrobacter sp.]|nr:hypothetical protein [Flavipsychrobacter sp.]
MFLILYSLLWINRDRKLVLPYAELNSCLAINTDSLVAHCHKLQEDYGRNVQKYFIHKTSYKERIDLVVNKTDSLAQYVRKVKSGIENTPPKTIIQKQLTETAYSVIKQVRNYLPSIDTIYQEQYFRLPQWLAQHCTDTLLIRQSISPIRLVTALNVILHDLAATEYIIVRKLISEGTPIYCLTGDQYAAIAIPEIPFVFPGQKVRGSIALVGYNKSIDLSIHINKGNINKTEYGVATWKRDASPLGMNTINGTASVDIDGRIKKNPFSFSYFVAAPGISLQLNNANTCYVGVENPITVSVPGFDAEKLSLNVKGAAVTKTSDGHFNIFFKSVPAGDTYAYVEGTNSEGTTSIVASRLLRVKELPPPSPAIGNTQSGLISLRAFRDAEGISLLRTDDFDMDYSFVRYSISLLRRNGREYITPVQGKGKYFSHQPKVEALRHIAHRGDRIFIEDIVVKDRSGKQLPLPPISLRLY